MIRALVIKELRESAALIALAALAVAWTLANLWGFPLTPWDRRQATELPFIQDDLLWLLAMIAPPLAIVLALKQTAWEDLRGTYFFLLHRPLSRSQVFLTKMAVGASVVMLAAGVPILAHALWAAAPGNHPSPFFWSMTAPAWQFWCVLPVLYLAAFLTGVRPARWYGSRLLPLLAGAGISFVLAAQPWCWITVVGSALLCALLVWCALYVSKSRDY